ncbi:MAG: hypothetical protein ACKO3F_16830, partial [Cyanobium sp.]
MSSKLRPVGQGDRSTTVRRQTKAYKIPYDVRLLVWQNMAKLPRKITIAAVVVGPFLVASATVAAESGDKLREAKIIGILGSKQVYINKEPARLNAVARSGGTIGTGGNSRARLLFDPRVVKDNIGLLKPNTRIKIGSRCFNLEDGEIW